MIDYLGDCLTKVFAVSDSIPDWLTVEILVE